MRVGLITGVSRGLGRALLQLAERRFDAVIAIGRSLPSGSAAIFLIADLAKAERWDEELARAIPASATELTFIDNAAHFAPMSAADAQFTKELERSLHVNLISPAAIMGALIRICEDRDIVLHAIHVSTGAATRPIAGWGNYCASKAAAAMFWRQLMLEHPHAHIRIIDPGVIDTDMQAMVRSADIKVVPDRDRFRQMAGEGALLSPLDAAERLFGEAGM